MKEHVPVHRPLEGMVVSDLSESVGGQFAARLFADSGAVVVLLEGEGGSATRRQPPFVNTSRSKSASLLFRHLNWGKVKSQTSGVVEQETLSGCDAVVVSDSRRAEHLFEMHPGLVVGVVEDFPTEGPYRRWLGSELIFQALSGSMYSNGLEDREPLFGVGRRAEYAAGLNLFIGMMAALINRQSNGGVGELVATTVYEAAVAMEQNFSTQWAYSGVIARRGELKRPRAVLPCRDGWVVLFALPGTMQVTMDFLGATELSDDPRFSSWDGVVENFPEWAGYLAEKSRACTRLDLLEGAQQRGIVLAPMLSLEEVLDDHALSAKGFWREDADVDGEKGLRLGPIWTAERVPGQATSAPSAIHNGYSDRPLAGIRIVDFSTSWSGPMASRILGFLGADVIKIEGPGRPDGWRGGTEPAVLDYYPDLDGGSDPLNRNSWFNTQNTDKRSLVVDLKNEKGAQIVGSLISESDVVMSNFAPGAMARLGLGPRQLAVLRPGIVVLEMSAYGSVGELASVKGLGPTMEAMSGISSLIGYDGGEPIGSGSAYLDPMGALVGAAAALVGLAASGADGMARHLEVSQREAAMHWIGELLLERAANGKARRPTGNAIDGAFPHGAYPAAGDDEWIALATFDDEQWRSLCRVAGWGDWMALGLAERLAISGEVDGRLGQWTAQFRKETLSSTLQDAGVHSAPVCNGRDLYMSPQLRAIDWFVTLEHPSCGVHDYPRAAIRLSHRPGAVRAPAPRFGEHSRPLLSQRGLGTEEIDGLVAAGVVVT